MTLVDALVPGHGGNHANVDGLEGAEVVLADLRDSERLAPLVERAELLFNLAGQTSHLDSMEDPFADLELNCAAQLALLENCRRHNPGVRIVFAGTRQVYGRPRIAARVGGAPDRPGRRQRDPQARRGVVPPALRQGVRAGGVRAAVDEHVRAADACP